MKRSTRSAAAGSNALFAWLVGISLSGFTSTTPADEIRIDSSILTVAETVEVPAPHAGVLRDLAIREGSTLRLGDRIAEVDSREQRLQVEVIQQDLDQAKLESESDLRVRLASKENRVAEAELSRATSVNAQIPNTVSAKEVDRLRLALERTELEIENATFERELLVGKINRIRADLQLAQHRVERMQIQAPINGIVAELMRRSGEWVDAGETVARIVRVDRLRVEGYVRIEHALRGLVNRPVVVQTQLPSGEQILANGKIVFVSPEAEPVEAKVRFWAEVDNRSLRLRPGLTASVVIHELDSTPSQTTHRVTDR